MDIKVISFAKDELSKYLEILGVSAEIELKIGDFAVEQPYFDDAYSISVKTEKV